MKCDTCDEPLEDGYCGPCDQWEAEAYAAWELEAYAAMEREAYCYDEYDDEIYNDYMEH